MTLTLFQRRLSAEWSLLLALVERNPLRLDAPTGSDTSFFVTLHGASALVAPGGGVLGDGSGAVHAAERRLTSHSIRIHFPVHFPAVPMELYLHTPVLHPNVHPETGFVCLWDRHRVSNTVEHAIHKVAAVLNGTLYNADPLHLMQPAALALVQQQAAQADLLLGVEYTPAWQHVDRGNPAPKSSAAEICRRTRLS